VTEFIVEAYGKRFEWLDTYWSATPGRVDLNDSNVVRE
jgi:hypothetical protein